jgi:hypothetical protein
MRKSLTVFSLLTIWSIFIGLTLLTVLPSRALTPTPTYDPLVEPPLPAHPTELELGRNLYWHWCMTCHGDQGQGLTDEWRAVWVSDHQNCWARGCHAGHNGDTAFPLPTVIPAIVGNHPMQKFPALADLFTYLKGTHPPQHPGSLEEKEYHAIAVYVFALNNRQLAEATVTLTVTPLPTLTPPPTPAPSPAPAPEANPWLIGLPLLVLFGVLGLLIKKRRAG